MAGLDPAIHDFIARKITKGVDARLKAGHDEFGQRFANSPFAVNSSIFALSAIP
jgi:hypothetical protein